MSQTSPNRGLNMEIQFLKGVGPRSAMLLAKLGLHTVEDVLQYFPRRYEDRTALPPMVMLRVGEQATVRGTIKRIGTRGTRRGQVIISATLTDGTGEIDLVWFNQPWVERDLRKAQGAVIAFGRVTEGMSRRLEMAAPEYEWLEEDDEGEEFARIYPVYPLTEGVPQRTLRKAAASAIEYFGREVVDPLPDPLRKRHRLQRLAWCITQMHRPDSVETQLEARRRLAFEEFFYLQMTLQMKRRETKQEVGIVFPVTKITGIGEAGRTLFGEDQFSGDLWSQVHKMLPFELTNAQKRVIGEIWVDMELPVPMNRLLQGDVGSGKTAVAACAMLAAVRCGYQAALMAPTEILAVQHGLGLSRLFAPLGINVELIVGKLGAKAKRKALDATKNGESQIIVGTHALIQEGVEFAKLGFAVIDEQHRFGVRQRMALRQKGTGNPDVLVMTATPIPRTLTMGIYGDLDLSVIDELPPGRMPIKTHWKRTHQRPLVYETVRDLIKEGRQAYFVCPLIGESDKMQTQAAEQLYEELSQRTYADLCVALLHGQMKPIEKEEVMNRFRAGEIDILVSTVVIEVGVDVPNASVMVVEDANRFGLAQLHQLRGRVGRGIHQSFCILISEAKSIQTEQRLRILVETTDGFRIAEEDLKIRGPGDVIGTRQSGLLDFKVANLIEDGALLEEAKQAAISVLDADPTLTDPAHHLIVEKTRSKRSDEALIIVS